MRVKNISFVEQHIERIVVAVAAIACLLVLWLFVVGSPYKVKMGSRQVPVARVEQEVRDELDRLDRAMRRVETEELDAIRIDGWTDQFQGRGNTPVLEAPVFGVIFSHPGLDPSGIAKPKTAETVFQEPAVPAPDAVLAKAGHHVLALRAELIDELMQRQPMELDEGSALEAATRDADRLIAMVGGSEPYDFQDVTVKATFDMDRYIAVLTDQKDPGKIPNMWWQGRLLLVDVVLERQAKDPRTGQWPPDNECDTVDTLPGTISFRVHTGPGVDWESADTRDLIEQIYVGQDQIARPPFVPLAQHSVWLPPDEQRPDLSEQKQRELFRINLELERLRMQWERLVGRAERAQRQDAEGPGTAVPAPRSAAPRGGFGPGGFGPGGFGPGGMGEMGRPTPRGSMPGRPGGAAGGSRTTPRTRPDREARTRSEPDAARQTVPETQRLQEQIQRISDEMQKLATQKEELLSPLEPGVEGGNAAPGVPGAMPRPTDPRIRMPMNSRDMPFMQRGFGGGLMPGMFPGPAGMGMMDRMPPRGGMAIPMPRPTRRPGRALDQPGAEPGQALPNRIDVWAHDLAAKPGHVYRYRLRVRVLNPLFQRDGLTPEQKEKYGSRLALDSAHSAWSEEVALDPKVQFFVVQADSQNNRATVEVYRMFDGTWRQHTFRVAPGDPIGGIVDLKTQGRKLSMDMQVGGLALDVEGRGAMAGSPSNSHVLVFYDPLTDQLAERTAELDRDDAGRVRLRNEAIRGEAEEAEVEPGAEPGPDVVPGPRPGTRPGPRLPMF